MNTSPFSIPGTVEEAKAGLEIAEIQMTSLSLSSRGKSATMEHQQNTLAHVKNNNPIVQ